MTTNQDYIERVAIMQHDGFDGYATINALRCFDKGTVLYWQDYEGQRDVAVQSCKKWCEMHCLTNEHVKIIDTGERIEVRSRYTKSVYD